MSLCRCFKILPCTFCTICTFSTQPVLFLSSLYLFLYSLYLFLYSLYCFSKKIHACCFHPFRVGHNYLFCIISFSFIFVVTLLTHLTQLTKLTYFTSPPLRSVDYCYAILVLFTPSSLLPCTNYFLLAHLFGTCLACINLASICLFA